MEGDFKGDLSVEPGVDGQVDRTHPPLAERPHDPVAAELLGRSLGLAD